MGKELGLWPMDEGHDPWIFIPFVALLSESLELVNDDMTIEASATTDSRLVTEN